MRPYYDDGVVTIYHADCREILPELDDIGLVFTSPPYLTQRDYTQPVDDWTEVVPPALAAVRDRGDTQVLVNLGLVHRDGNVVPYWDYLTTWMQKAAWRLFGWYVWDQGGGLPGDWNGRFGPSHEFIFHFNRKAVPLEKWVPTASFGRRTTGTGLRRADGTTGSVSHFGADVQPHKIHDSVFRVTREMLRDLDHPARFPIRLPFTVIQSFPRSGLVVDPFMGSGTTLRAAKNLNRRAVGIDIEERYCEMAATRCSQDVLELEGVA